MAVRWFSNLHPGLAHFWHPVAAEEHLDGDGPHSVRLMGDDYALYRFGDSWQVARDVCPHRLAPLSQGSITASGLQCAYHGWCFDSDGQCVDLPALGPNATRPPTAKLTTVHAVAERYGLIWVALAEPLADIPAFAEWDNPAFGKALMAPATWNASAAQMADNFLDVAHFPFTHLGTIGDPDDLEVHPYEVERDRWRFRAVHRHSSKVFTDATAGAVEGEPEDRDFEVFDRTMTFVCDAPHHVYLHIDYGEAGDLVLAFFHQPVDAESTTMYCRILAENIADGRSSAEDHIAFQEQVGHEDRMLLETLVTKAVPLDPGVETHTRADKTTVELRRLLSDIDRHMTWGES